jgi:hypothetical protein
MKPEMPNDVPSPESALQRGNNMRTTTVATRLPLSLPPHPNPFQSLALFPLAKMYNIGYCFSLV